MDRKTSMVKEYDTQQEFNTDELKLSREGWSVEPAANQAAKQGLVDRIRGMFMGSPKAERLVVTYTRQRPG